MPQRITIDLDGYVVTIDQPMTHAQAREWLMDQAVRLTQREPFVSPRARQAAAP